MKKVYLQYWEEAERGWGVRPDGCSLHKTLSDHKKYLTLIYSQREPEVPDEYSRIVGEPIEVMIKENLLEEFSDDSLRLWRHELNNLLQLEEIINIGEI